MPREAVLHCCGAPLALPVRAVIITVMTNWFVFNGDADGLCAAHQLRLAGHAPDHVITGVKRDIALLTRCDARTGDTVWVADISLDTNRIALEALLARGVSVRWFDHHHAGVIPTHAALHAHIDTSAALCSSLLVDHFVGGRFRAWAVTAAFGDNLAASARDAARATDLTGAELDQLAELGTLMNYNAYGETVADLHVDPARLFERIALYDDPRKFLAHDAFANNLRDALASDLAAARAAPCWHASTAAAAYELPTAPWARRVQGVWANELAAAHPQRAHALLVRAGAGYSVSVRAPLARPVGADALCRQFATGGGRAGAAGINALPADQKERFLSLFVNAYLHVAPA